MSDPDEFLRTNDIAKLLKVSKKTVERLYRSGEIRRRHLSARCAGAMRRDVVAYLEAR
jgi:hypothetical protein